MTHPTPHSQDRSGFFARIARLVRHRWAEGELRRALPSEVLQRLTQRVAASEARHTGQISICVEGGLPLSYIWRGASARERAIMQFGKLRVWDTEHNNGVLIYLLSAEHAIEIIADRGIARSVEPAVWQQVIARMREEFRAGRYEDGLTEALSQVSAALVAQYPASDAPGQRHPNELPNAPVVLGD